MIDVIHDRIIYHKIIYCQVMIFYEEEKAGYEDRMTGGKGGIFYSLVGLSERMT